MRLGPYEVDRFYHVISPSDDRMLSTIAELGLTDRLSFAETRVGVYMDGVVRPFDGIADLLRFSPLTPVQRARLGWFLTRCKVAGDPETLDGIPLEQWVRTHCGDRIWDRFWLPLFNSRFENDLDGLPATYLWARSRRMANARTGPRQGERFAMLRGGHQALIDALIAATRELGSDVVTSCPAEGLVVGTDGGVDGVDARGEAWHFDLTVSTLPPPALQRLLPVESLPGLAGMPSRILGVVCLVATLRDSISPFYSVNICGVAMSASMARRSPRSHADPWQP